MDPLLPFLLTVLLSAATAQQSSFVSEMRKVVDIYYRTFLDHMPYWSGDRYAPDVTTATRVRNAATASEKVRRLIESRRAKARFFEKARSGYVSDNELREAEILFRDLERWMRSQISRQDWRDWLFACSAEIMDERPEKQKRGREELKATIGTTEAGIPLLPMDMYHEFMRDQKTRDLLLPALRQTDR